ncbi:2176_t:CDS:2, partial [Racocetra fulgida]
AAKNTETGEQVAIKKVTKVFEKNILAKRALREVKLLKHFSGHENVNSPDHNAGFMTEYVATRWYRAPEIMLSFQNYTKARRDYVDQLNQILGILGTPDEETLRRANILGEYELTNSLYLLLSINDNNNELQYLCYSLALDLLEKLLKFDPAARITVEQALAHPYLAAYHDEEDEEVMSFKASKQASLGLNCAQLGPQQRQQTNRNSFYEYGAASQHAAIPSASMEVDELEKEL